MYGVGLAGWGWPKNEYATLYLGLWYEYRNMPRWFKTVTLIWAQELMESISFRIVVLLDLFRTDYVRSTASFVRFYIRIVVTGRSLLGPSLLVMVARKGEV